MGLTAKTVLITGASRGLGLGFVTEMLKLSKAPDTVIATCRNPDKADELKHLAKTHHNLKIVKLDVEKPEDIDSAYQETVSILADRGLNLIINNAGVFDKSSGNDITGGVNRDIMNEHFDVNCTAPMMIAQKFLPLVEKAAVDKNTLSCSQSAIVMLSTIMASKALTHKGGFGTTYYYKCSKAALDMAVLLMSRELSSRGILVMGIHPGWVTTDMGGDGASITASESVTSVLNVLASAGPDCAGKVKTYEGSFLPF